MQRRFRLRHADDFARLRREGRAYRHDLMILSLAPNGLSHNRYGTITSKRLGKAVTRNRTRRIIREVVRQLHPHLQTGFDVLIVARPPVVGQHFARILDTVSMLCRRSGLIVEGESS